VSQVEYEGARALLKHAMAVNTWDDVTGIFSSQMISTVLISTPHSSLEFDWLGKIASMTIFCTDRMEYY
jgi:hypothetical protein